MSPEDAAVPDAPGGPIRFELPGSVVANAGESLHREWLVSNGIGGFASGTVAGALTRRYHGLLIAALDPPLGRTLLVAKLEDAVRFDGSEHPLSCNVWGDGLRPADGSPLLEGFALEDGVPTWRFAVAGGTLERRVWMEPGRNRTYVRYALREASTDVALLGRFLLNCRDYHGLTRAADWRPELTRVDDGLHVRVHGSAVPIHLRGPARVSWNMEPVWYYGFRLPAERARGMDDVEDHLCVAAFELPLASADSATFSCSADPQPSDADALPNRRRAARRVTADATTADPAMAQLSLAAEQFVVRRKTVGGEDGYTILAGYPWFTDWGRDTMIALPGLTLVTGRFEVARDILQTWARYVDRGMIPNRFPDEGETPDYNSADATLWYLWAVDQYLRATDDAELARELFPVLAEITSWYRRGTRHNIHVDDDGLLYAGEAGVNLTWMDAKIGDRVITPRIGKPVELNALWYDALCNLARIAEALEQPSDEFRRGAERSRDSFGRFWNEDRGCCFDVLDGPDGEDPLIRPNQILGVSLGNSPLAPDRQRAVVDVCERELLTPFGLRSLAPGEPGYRGHYAGGWVERDEAYHQGTVWGWLMGPFIEAHLRVFRDGRRAAELLRPMLDNLSTHGVGTLSEIFDGDAPHTPRGCIAQAWTVAECLRALRLSQLGAGTAPRPDSQ